MSFICDDAMDAGLAVIKGATTLLLCSSEPATRAAAVAAQLASKASPSFGTTGDGTSGREFAVTAITDASGDADGTATHWALIDGTDLLAAGALSSSVSIASGSTVSIESFTVGLNDPS